MDKSVDYRLSSSIIIYCYREDVNLLKYGSVRPFNSETTASPLKKRLIIRRNTTKGPKSDQSTKGQSIKSMFLAIYSKWSLVFLMVFSLSYSLPVTTNAGILSFLSDFFTGSPQKIDTQVTMANSQNIPLLTSTVNFDSNAAVGGGDITVANNNEALVSESGPSGTFADIGNTVNTGQISKYIVRKGDSLASIAKMYGVTTNTIVWANSVTSSSLKEGQSLVILPVSGTLHTVVKGDTLSSIVKKYKADLGEVSQFNDLDSSSKLAIGDVIIIPDGEGTTKVSGVAKSPAKGVSRYLGDGGPEYPGYYIRPLLSGIKTQGLHGYNAIDIGTHVGTTLYAAAAGQVIIARSSGWNGGYGKYIVISHYNGTQTVYGHMSQVFVNDGELVYQGQVIGLTGNTGNSTGPHLHFEIRGAKNPF